VCNHPFLIKGVEEKETVGKIKEDYFNAMINSSGKLILLDKLLPKLRAGGHKVLIFSQMIKVLNLLETYLRSRSFPYERLDGGVRGNERQASIDRFCKPGSDRFVFLLCTRAGGVGINLTSADTVIIYDSDWNPQVNFNHL
jgi:SNF2 family DNA or RNA helicase